MNLFTVEGLPEIQRTVYRGGAHEYYTRWDDELNVQAVYLRYREKNGPQGKRIVVYESIITFDPLTGRELFFSTTTTRFLSRRTTDTPR